MQVPQIQQSNVQISSNHQSLIKIDNVFFHCFTSQNNKRQLIDICTCQIFQSINIQGTSAPSYIIKLGQFSQQMQPLTFLFHRFQNLTTYIFQNKQSNQQIYLFSIQNFNPLIDQFIKTMKQSSYVTDYKIDSYGQTELHGKINQICQGQLTEEMVEDIGSIGTVLKTVGAVLGSVSRNVVDPTIKAEIFLQNSVKHINQNYISDVNKDRWNSVKQTATQLNQKITTYVKPIDTAFQLLFSSIGQTFNRSENKYIQNVIKYGKATAKTLNKSYMKAEQMIIGNNDTQQQQQLQQNRENIQNKVEETSTHSFNVNSNDNSNDNSNGEQN